MQFEKTAEKTKILDQILEVGANQEACSITETREVAGIQTAAVKGSRFWT